MSEPMTPRTAAGRSLLEKARPDKCSPPCLTLIQAEWEPWSFAESILAIEAEAVASWLASPEAEEALARALAATYGHGAPLPPADLVLPEQTGVWDISAARILAALRGESDG